MHQSIFQVFDFSPVTLRLTYHPLVPECLEILELPLGGVVALGVGLVKHLGSADPEKVHRCFIIIRVHY